MYLLLSCNLLVVEVRRVLTLAHSGESGACPEPWEWFTQFKLIAVTRPQCLAEILRIKVYHDDEHQETKIFNSKHAG
jgi:hypothetical protein